MQHLFWALVAALMLRGAERGASNPGGCLKGIVKAALIAGAVLVLLSLLASGMCTRQT